MFERFQAHLEKSNLIPPRSTVLVGYSGGADSTCLLHMLHRYGVDVVAGHLHHGQRPEADIELKLCEAFCKELGIVFLAGRADVPLLSADLSVGLEEAGRIARYQFFEQAAASARCSLVATAHTRTDLAETVLLNVARGTGLSGIAGIPQKRDLIVRPLLPFTRRETQAYCAKHGLWTHDDPANEDLSFSRARIRHRVLPELQSINPRSEDAISRLAETAGEEDRFLNGMAAAALEQSEVQLNGPLRFLTIDVEAAFDRAKMSMLPAVLFRRALRLAASALGGSLSFEQINVLVNSIAAAGHGSVTAEGGEVVVEFDDDLIIVRHVKPTTPFRYPLTLPGETSSDEFGWQFTAFEAGNNPKQPTRASLETAFSRAAISGPLFFRTPQAGDHMRPMGFKGRRKLSDLLSEAKLTQAARSRLPVVCDMIGPLWAPGVCLDERARPASASVPVVVLKFGPLPKVE